MVQHLERVAIPELSKHIVEDFYVTPEYFRDTLSTLQQTLDSFRSSRWLGTGPIAGGSYPPLNIFRKGDDFIVITEVPFQQTRNRLAEALEH